MIRFKLYKDGKPYDVCFRIDQVLRLETEIGKKTTKVVFKDDAYDFIGSVDGFLDACKNKSRTISSIEIMDLMEVKLN